MSILRADSIRDRAGTGAPDFPNGATVTGVVTATSFSGDGSALTGIDSSAIKDGSDVKVQAISTGANVTGNLAATGNVTAVDGTFSGNATVQGNLTVNGTTTTIDTAVTSVDSLSVDGDVGIGTTNPTSNLSIFGVSPKIFLKDTTVGQAGVGSAYLHNNLTQSRFEIGINDRRCIHFGTGGDVVLSFDNSGKFLTTSDGVRVVGECQVDGVGVFRGGLVEKYKQGTTLAAASNEVALSSGNVHRFTTNESGAQTVNFTGVHSTLANGESVSFTVILTPNNSGYINAATVDGVAPFAGLKWSGGSAPSASSSGRDVYTFTIFKDGSATNSYEIFGAMTNYA